MTKEIAFGIIISVLFVGLIALFCGLLIKLYIKKINDHNQRELEFQQAIKEAMVETQEQVINDISRDLHDDAGQQLTSINFQIENLKLDSPELEKTLEPVSKSVAQLSQSIRELSHSLNNQLEFQQDLIKAIASDIKRLKKNKKIAVHYTFEELAPKVFSEKERIFIYRIFQQCVSNCLKHSKATTIEIVIRLKPEFEMLFSDNGTGFDPAVGSGKRSMGLISMKTRAEKINYSLTLNSKIGEGTAILLTELAN